MGRIADVLSRTPFGERHPRGTEGFVGGPKIPWLCGFVTASGAALVLLGWLLASPMLVRLGVGQTPMLVNAALCLLALGAGLLLHDVRPRSSSALAAGVAVLATMTLAEHLFGVNLGVDTALFGDTQRSLDPGLADPGRMSRPTALALILLAVSLVLSRVHGPVSHVLALAGVSISYIYLLSHAYGAADVQSGWFARPPTHMAVLVMVAGLGIFWTRSGIGLLGYARSSGVMGALVRLLILFTVLIPPAVGAIRLVSERAGLYEPPFGVAITTLQWTLFGLATIWIAARAAAPIEQARTAALQDSRAAQQRLRLVEESSRLFASTVVLQEVLDLVVVRVAETIKDACVITLLDDSGTVLSPLSAHHPDADKLRLFRSVFGQRLRVGEGFAGKCAESGQPLIVPRIDPAMLAGLYADPDVELTVQDFALTSLIAAPLRSRGRLLGVLVAVRTQTPEPYAQGDLEVLVDLADRSAQAIDTAQMVEASLRADQALAELGSRALAAHSPEVLAQDAVDLLAEALRARYVLFVAPGAELGLNLAAVSAPDGEESPLRIGDPITQGVLLRVYEDGQGVVCDDLRHDPDPAMVELGRVLDADSGLAVPIAGRGGRRGVLSVASKGVGRFTEEDLQFQEAFAGLVATGLDRLDADANLRRIAEQRQQLLGRLVSAQEEERGRIADGVHDDQVQSMAALDLRLSLLQRRLGDTNPELVADVTRARASASGALSRLRALLFELQPPDPSATLADALREAATFLFEDVDTTCDVQVDAGPELPATPRLVAYRVAKEALVNIRKHARAASVVVDLRHGPDVLEVTVVDDGVGMESSLTRSPVGHLGLSSMHDRVAVAGGRLRVSSRPGGGTSVEFWIPRADADSQDLAG